MVSKKPKNWLHKLWNFATRNWFITIFLACILFVGFVSFYKLFLKQEQFVYAKVKVSQGFWWANTAKAPIWLVRALKPGEVEKSLTGDPTAEILSVRYYPWWSSNQYDIYLTLKLKVSSNEKTGTYNFKRSTLAIGSPIELSFPSVETNGTVIDLKSKPIKSKLTEKTITMTKSNGFQWEYEAIKIGDKYYDGEEVVLEVFDKYSQNNPLYNLDDYGYGRVFGSLVPEARQIITVKLLVKAKPSKQNLIYGEEYELIVGQGVNVSTNSFNFQDYRLTKVE